MVDHPVTQAFKRLLLSATPLMDVRAPIEYINGAFPCSENVPLLSDEEREQIGICYKNRGHQAAVALGKELVSGDIKASRISAWKRYLDQNPGAVLYCFRGGMRSQVAQQWIRESLSLDIPRVAGGYKALRRYLIDELERLVQGQFVRLGGRTGAGKTLFLYDIHAGIDLEGLANHKGSAFGYNVTPQPTQIQFENTLAIALLQHEEASRSPLLVEDEGRNIGGVHLPKSLYENLCTMPIVVLDQPLERRIEISLDAYVGEKLPAFQRQLGEEAGLAAFKEDLFTNLAKIKRRMGPQRYAMASSHLTAAFDVLEKTASTSGFEPLIEMLLTQYYDPMYDYQLSKKESYVVFTGGEAAVRDYCEAQLGIS